MIYENKEEALKSREKSVLIKIGSEEQQKYNEHSKKWTMFQSAKFEYYKMGKLFLYEKVLNRSGIIVHYPRLGVYLNELPIDQTTEIEWVDYRRSWEWNTKFKYIFDNKEYTNFVGEIPTEVQRLILWSDDMLIYGAWDSMPSFRELKQAYERTWWFYRTEQEKRDLQLNRILS